MDKIQHMVPICWILSTGSLIEKGVAMHVGMSVVFQNPDRARPDHEVPATRRTKQHDKLTIRGLKRNVVQDARVAERFMYVSECEACHWFNL